MVFRAPFSTSLLPGNSVHEEVHLNFTLCFQCPFKTVDACLINIILRQVVPPNTTFFLKKNILPDIQLTSVF